MFTVGLNEFKSIYNPDSFLYKFLASGTSSLCKETTKILNLVTD